MDFSEKSHKEQELAEIQALLKELEGLLDTFKRHIEEDEFKLYVAESKLAQALEAQEMDTEQKKLVEEINELLKKWKEAKEEYKLNPGDKHLEQEITYIERDLNSAIDQKIMNKKWAGQDISFAQKDVEFERKNLALERKWLVDWEENKVEIMKDRTLLAQEIQKFKSRYESKN